MVQMSIVQDSENLTGGRRVCEDCEEAARELLWCENCRISLCFECDSHCHHAKSSQGSHLRVLLPSACTLSSLPLISAHTKPGTNVLSEASNPAKAWRNSSNGISADVRELHGSRSDAFDSLPPAFCLKEKRKRKKKRGKDDVALSCATETAANNFELKKPQQEPGAGETLSSNPVSSLTGSTLNIRVSRESKLLEHGEDSMHESDTSDLSFCSSSQSRSPTLSFARSVIPTLELLKSALRGGHQGSGLGPRPKLHVNWHPDVYDPICSTVSHTLGGNQQTPVFLSRRNYQKHLRHKNKGQSNSQASGKKQGSNAKAKKPGGSPNARSHASPVSHQLAETLGCFEAQKKKGPLSCLHDSLLSDDVPHHCTEIVTDLPTDVSVTIQSEVAACLPEVTLLEKCIGNPSNGGSHGKLVHKDAISEKPSDTSVQEYSPTCLAEIDTVTPKGLPLDTLSSKGPAIGFRSANSPFVNTELSDGGNGVVEEVMPNTGNNGLVIPHQSHVANDMVVLMKELIVDQSEIDESMAAGFPECCHRAVGCMIHAAKLAAQGEPLGAMVKYEAAACLFREAERTALKDAAHESVEVAKQAVQGQVAAWISVAALCSQTGNACWAENCHLQLLCLWQSSVLKLDAGKCLLGAGKCQVIQGERSRAYALFSAATLLFEDCEAEREQIADKELNCGAANDELKELVVKASQLAGAVALDSHNVDAGKKLLLGALVAACELQSKAEEAHCLRLLANLQEGEQYLKSLQAAVDGFSACDLPYAHAEALFSVAALKITLHSSALWENQSMSGSQGAVKRPDYLESAKHDLQAAAFLLEGKCDLPKISSHCRPSGSKSQDGLKHLVFEFPYGHEQAGENQSFSYVELCGDQCGPCGNTSIYLELLGRIHGACAKVCVLLDEKIEAETYLGLALKNKEWVRRCKSDASCAKALLERLHWQGSGTCRKSWQVLEGSLIGM